VNINDAARPVAGRPPRRWLAIALVIVPCLLTWVAATYGVLLSFIVGVSACLDTCYYQGWFQTPPGTWTILAAELVLGLSALVILIAGLLSERRRRALGLAGWIVFLLACTAAGLLAWSP
jgi:hypothetical protein